MDLPTTSRSNKNPDHDNDHTDVNVESGATGSVDIGSFQPIVEATVEDVDHTTGVNIEIGATVEAIVEDVDHTGVNVGTGATGSADIGGSIPPTVQAIVQATIEGVDDFDGEQIIEKIDDIDGEIEATVIDSIAQDTNPKSTIEENKNQNIDGSITILRHDYDTSKVGIGKTILPTPPEGCNLVIPLGSTSITLSKYSRL